LTTPALSDLIARATAGHTAVPGRDARERGEVLGPRTARNGHPCTVAGRICQAGNSAQAGDSSMKAAGPAPSAARPRTSRSIRIGGRPTPDGAAQAGRLGFHTAKNLHRRRACKATNQEVSLQVP
jgi:hypothetical protein